MLVYNKAPAPMQGKDWGRGNGGASRRREARAWREGILCLPWWWYRAPALLWLSNGSVRAGGRARLSSARRRTPQIVARRAGDRRALPAVTDRIHVLLANCWLEKA